MRPILCEPVYLPSVWAGDRLTKIRGSIGDKIGISREICAYKNSENKILNSEYTGMNLKDLITKYPEELFGEFVEEQLVRVAFMDTVEDLSIQLHPDKIAGELLGDYEKSESWYIVDCDQGASVYVGTNCFDKVKIREAAEYGTLEQFLIKKTVQPGDMVFVPAKMMHACGANILALEVGSFGGITYRLYDYGRPRPLDLDKGIALLDPYLGCDIMHNPFEDLKENRIVRSIDYSQFKVDIIDVVSTIELTNEGRYFILTCVAGEATITYQQKQTELGFTKTVLIPAACDSIMIEGNCRLIKSFR